MAIEVLLKNYSAEGAIAAFRIAKHGTADGQVLQAAAATDLLIGVNGSVAPALGERVDLVKIGIADVEYGGVVTRGAPLTSDASGRAVVAAPAAGSNVRIVGYAEVAGVLGDIGSVHIALGVMQG